MARALVLSFLAAQAWAACAADAATLHVAHDAAEPPFAVDVDLCGEAGGGGLVGYVGEDRVCADALIREARDETALVERRIDEIVLLTSSPGGTTVYRVGEHAVILPIANLVRPSGRPLTVRGQRGPGGAHLVWLRGRDLVDSLCDPGRVLDPEGCRLGAVWEAEDPERTEFDGRYELSSLAAIENAQHDRARGSLVSGFDLVTERGSRADCVRLSNVRGVALVDLAFEDCWAAAILAVNAQDISVERALIHGSTFGLAAIASSGMEAASHTYRLLDSRWVQSPAGYRPEAGRPCDRPESDITCPIDVWDDIPWGVTHHHLWRPLNGALFSGYNIAGNVLIAGNTIERAYNGIRIISELPFTGRNVEIRDNDFRFVRDNAVEPENHADGWVIKHNRFQNVHAWISSDGVDGGEMYVFGNVGWYDPDRMPGRSCSEQVDWTLSPRFIGLTGDHGRYELIDVSYDQSSVECDGHYRGVILKTGDKLKAGFPYLERISIFNNSWRTRSPLFSSKHAAPLSHFNNAIEFTGCGLDGPVHCRQIPAPVEYCAAGNKRTRGQMALAQYWTEDRSALVADCFSFVPGPAVPDDRAGATRTVAHAFCRDAVNRAFDGVAYGPGGCEMIVREKLFGSAAGPGLVLAEPIAGCGVTLDDGGGATADCGRKGVLVGAFQSDGALFDVEIPGAGFLGARFVP